ncbi:MAG: hypothetical protein QNK24_16760 [Desulfuromusa sp.]|nr:hypothetical protein [Desulfuromusa sp.]
MNATFAKTFCWGLLCGILLLTAGTLTESQAAEIGEFKGTWVANGTRKPFAFSEDRKIYTFEISGYVNLQTDLGKKSDYWSTCVGFADTVTGMTARCVWKDLDGPEIYITLKSDRMQSDDQVTGIIVGGTDHLEGISGNLSFAWLTVTVQKEAGAESVTAQTLNLSGTYRMP